MNHKSHIAVMAALVTAFASVGVARAVTDEEFNALKLKVLDLESKAGVSEEATAKNNFVMAGGVDVNYQKTQGENGGFLLGSFNPIFLLRSGDKVLFEGALEFNVQNQDNGASSVETVVEFAQVSYLVNDWLTLTAGKIVLPLGSFIETTDPAWINKLPTFPLPRADQTAILPESDIGVQAHGGISLGGGSYINYGAFVVNGPGHTSSTDTNGVTTETLSFDSVENQNNSLGFGGKLGCFTPLAESSSFEIGVSGESGKWDSQGQNNWSVLVCDARLHVTPAAEIRGEYIHSSEDTATGTLTPKGWWIQGAYQLSGLDTDVALLNKLELVARYAQVDLDQGDGAIKQTALGVDYHITGTLALKGDYEINSADNPDAAKNTVNLQIAYGF
ncbi:MAG: hypothetical protein EPN23_07825 [Verrucomicrobia bacterium]|nr:MAG: hypothetical protein EPN23_07825 [Verrucomicrobiota bacterium]